MQELTRAQQEYFNSSKIRDEQGKLMILYHGSKSVDDFDTFANIKTEPGYWFTADKEYAQGHGDNVVTCYLNVKNPWNLDDPAVNLVAEVKKCYPGMDLSTWDDKIVFSKQFGEHLKRQGYDGMMWTHSGEWTVVAFEPNQIKSIDNLYPTKSDNFKDNSQEYLKEHLKDMSMEECMKLTKYIKEHSPKETKDRNVKDKER